MKHNFSKTYKKHTRILRKKKKAVTFYISKLFAITMGAAIAAIGLKLFLVPNNIIDGGVVGLSIMGEAVSGASFGIIMCLLSIPFIIYGWKRLGQTFALYTLYAVVALSIFSGIFAMYQPMTTDPFLAAIFGGIVDGIGVGLIIRNGGSLDGTEIVAIDVDKNTVFSTGEILMFINLFILSGAGFLFGFDKAMYSLVAYFVISKMIDVVVKGFNDAYSVMVVTSKYKDMTSVLVSDLNRGVTAFHAEGGYSGEEKRALYCIVSRLEIDKIKEAVQDVDDRAFIIVTPVNDTVGGRLGR